VGPVLVAMVLALNALSLDQRRVVVLHHVVGLSVEEIAQETGTPVGTVKSRLARGRQALARHLREREEPVRRVGNDA